MSDTARLYLYYHNSDAVNCVDLPLEQAQKVKETYDKTLLDPNKVAVCILPSMSFDLSQVIICRVEEHAANVPSLTSIIEREEEKTKLDLQMMRNEARRQKLDLDRLENESSLFGGNDEEEQP